MISALAQNLSVFRKHHPDLWREIPPFLKQFAMGFAPDLLPRSPTRCIPHPTVIPALQTALEQGMDFLYGFGMGDGSALLQIAPNILRGNRGILIIEPDWEHFLSVMQFGDFRPLLASPKVYWAIGKTIRPQIDAVLDQSLCYAAAHPHFQEFFLTPPSGDETEIQNLRTRLLEEIKKRKCAVFHRLKQLPLFLRNSVHQKIRIWSFQDLREKAAYTLIQHVLMRTLMFYFRQRGYETEYTVLKPNHYYPPYYRVLKMAWFEPNLIFLCNAAPAYEFVLGEKLSRSLPIPKVIWFADDPLYGEHLLERHAVAADETYLAADYEWADTLRKYGANPVHYMPGAATQTRRGKRRGSRVCDIVFVGQVRDLREFFQSLSSNWQEYCRRVITEKLRFPRKKVREVMAQFPVPGELPPDRLDEFRQKLLWEANTQFRLQIIRALSDFDLRIYGNEDWLRLLSPDLAQRCYRGVLRFQRLFEVYRNSRITLNIHSVQSYTCLNVRDFDVPAAGGFLLSDWLPKAEEIFHPGFVGDLPLSIQNRGSAPPPEVFFYRSIPELHKLVSYFLEHTEERKDCRERARQKVLAHHTYAHRAEWLHGLFQQVLAPYRS